MTIARETSAALQWVSKWLVDRLYENGEGIAYFGVPDRTPNAITHRGPFAVYDGRQWLHVKGDYIQRDFERELDTLRDDINEHDVPACVLGLLEREGNPGIVKKMWGDTAFCILQMHMKGRDKAEKLFKAKYEGHCYDNTVNCNNGLLSIEHEDREVSCKATLGPHSHEQHTEAVVNVDYNTNADTALWDKFMQAMFANSKDRDFVIKHFEATMGYVLQESRDTPSFAVFVSQHDNDGKSTFLNVLKALMPADRWANTEVISKGTFGRFGHADLIGKNLLLDESFPSKCVLDYGQIMKLGEGRVCHVEPRWKNSFTSYYRAFPLIVCDRFPAVDGHMGAVERRALVWELDPLPDGSWTAHDERELLTVGLEGAFLRFVQSYCDRKAREHVGNWALPGERIRDRNKWLYGDKCLFREWIEDCLESGIRGQNVRVSEGWDSFRKWHKNRGGILRHKMVQFRRIVSEILYEYPTKVGGYSVWKGFKLKEIENE